MKPDRWREGCSFESRKHKNQIFKSTTVKLSGTGEELEAARKTYDRSQVRKRSRSFLDELHSAIDNDPSVSLRSWASLMNVSKNTMRTSGTRATS